MTKIQVGSKVQVVSGGRYLGKTGTVASMIPYGPAGFFKVLVDSTYPRSANKTQQEFLISDLKWIADPEPKQALKNFKAEIDTEYKAIPPALRNIEKTLSLKPEGVMTTGQIKESPLAVAAMLTSDEATKEYAENSLASLLGNRLAPKTREDNWLDNVAGYTPTDEQKEILKLADAMQKSSEPGRVMVIGAGAGTGKTSTLRMLETILDGFGQYTAFNASLVAESRSKFKKAACNTTHSLAFKTVGRRYAHRLNSNRVRSYQVASMLGIEGMDVSLVPDPTTPEVSKNKFLEPAFLASQLMQAIRKFCQSADREISRKHFKYIDGIDFPTPGGKKTRANNDLVVEYLLPFANTAWDDLTSTEGSLPFNHDVYVKVWQLGEGDDKPYIPAAYILLDEAQDTAPVLLDILKQQTHVLLILVGDDNQQIYEWRGAVNAMASFPGAPRRLLSKSFRFGQVIADVANSVLAGLDEPTDLVMKGFLKIPSRVSYVNEPVCILCRTNAGAISRFLESIESGGKPYLVGGSVETVDFCKAAINLQACRRVYHPDLSCFSSWKEVQAYVKTDEGEDLKLMVKLIDSFGAQKIVSALEKMPEEKDADLVISTAHRSKGREWKTVKLAQDFPPAKRMGDSDRRLLYVALTRAQYILDITDCPPFSGGRNEIDGEELSTVTIRYTIPMPTKDDLAAYQAEQALREESKPVVTTPPVVSTGNSSDTAELFTWRRLEGQFVVQGPKGYDNQTVTVHRRDKTTSKIRIGVVLQEIGNACLYRVA